MPGELLAAQVALSQDAQLDPDPRGGARSRPNLMAFEPVVDGDVLADLPIRSIAAGAGRRRRLSRRHDDATSTGFFMVPNGIADHVDRRRAAVAAAPGLDPRPALRAYRAARPGGPGELLAD